MGVTIREVAAQAGVSASTVSLVLNNRPGIGDDTRLMVFKTAETMGYQIPVMERERKSGGTIRFLKIAKHGHIINRNHNVFIADYIDGLEKEARESGFSLEVQNYNGLDYEQIQKDLVESCPDGLIILATELDEMDIPRFENISVPMVFIDTSHPASPFDFVDMDNEGAVYSIVSELKKRGHQKIGMVKSSVDTRNFRLRERSFYEALNYYELPSRAEWTFSVDSTFEQASIEMEEELEEGRDMPTAFFCVCDIIAFACMKALKKKGFTLPEDVAVVGFDDLPSSQMSDPPLSSIKVSKKRIGRRAFQLLNRRLTANESLPYEKVFIGSELIIRESLGKNSAEELQIPSRRIK